ncbi:MAG: cell division protein FtsQ/DivIB [Candidatus Dormibacteria bacterium]
MSTAVRDDRDQQRAAARAEAVSILDRPRRAKRFQAVAGVHLRPSGRPRSHARPRPAPTERVRRPTVRRIVAAALVLLQVVLLVLALTLPVFQVTGAQVTGLHLLREQDVLNAAAVPHQSVFTVDTQGIRGRIEAMPWVASADVSTTLPASLHISVIERQVALRVRRDGVDTLVAVNGATLPVTAVPAALAAGAIPLIDDRAGSTAPIDPTLIQDLSTIAQRFPAVFGGRVAAYQWGVDDVLSLWAGSGWEAVLGHLDTQDAMAQLPAQIAALAALRGALDFNHPTFGYVDLEDAAAPAVGGKPGLPAEVQAAVQAAAAPSGPPAAAAIPVPNALPTPTPKPSPSASPRPSASASGAPPASFSTAPAASATAAPH